MRTFDIVASIASLASIVILGTLFYYNVYLAFAAIVLFFIGQWIYNVVQRR